VSVAPAVGVHERERAPWRVWLLAGAVMLAGALALRHWTPSDDPNATICLFRRWTHHDCATCGMTRALALLARGDVRGALARHPLSVPLAAEAAALWLLAPLAFARGWRFPAELRDRWLVAHALAFLGLWVVRLLT
jgi:Protein of unknown function (DUF2752)